MSPRLLCCALGALAVAAAGAAGRAAQAADNVVVPGTTDFPESVYASANGTLFFSSFAGGRIFRAKPGETRASEWIKQGSNGLDSATGVLADDKSNTLYVCSDDLSAAGVAIPTGATPTALKLFDLKTGAPKGSIALPGPATFCGDIAVAADGTAYVTDSLAGHILRLKPGAKELEIWAEDPRWVVKGGAQLDGIAILPDGAVYANIFEGDGLYRIAVNPDRGAGAITKLQTSRPLYHSDGLRAFGPNKLLMVEGDTRGFLDLITINGDKADIQTIKDGFKAPVALTQVGDIVYVLDVPIKLLFGSRWWRKTPPPFTAFAIKAPQQ